MINEKTLVIIKPGVLQRRVSGEIISRFEKKGLQINAMKMSMISSETAHKHYAEHLGKPFYEDLVTYISSGPAILMVVSGKEAVKIVRMMCGGTLPDTAAPGTIRGDYALSKRNIVHASDSVDTAKKEIDLYFKAEEILEYEDGNYGWIIA